MAKTKFQASKLDFNDDLDFDFDGLGGPDLNIKDDRHPVIKAATAAGKEAKSFVSSRNNVEKFLKAALPQGYGEAYDVASEARDELAGLYNTVSKDLEPVGQAARAMARKHLPNVEGKIPKGLFSKLKQFAGEDKATSGYNQARAREQELGGLLQEVFQAKAQDEVKLREEINSREKVRQGFEQVRHRDQISQLDEIRKAVQGIDNYNNKVVYNYQRKTLELGYRQYWAMADLVQEQKISNQNILNELKLTVKNTGLPDFVKTRSTERFKELSRNRFLEGARDKFIGGSRDYLRNFSKNIEAQLRSMTGAASSMAQMGAMGSSMDFDDSPKKTLVEQIAQFATNQGMEYGSEFLADKARSITGGDRTVRKRGMQAKYQSGRVGEIIGDHLNDPTKSWGVGDFAKRWLASAAPAKTTSTRMDVDNNARGMEARPFSRNNSKTIDEIIPGLLSRIYREVKIIRTGDESTELITYDYTKNRFTTESKAAGSVKGMFQGKASEIANEKVDKLLNKIDPSGKLTAEQRKLAKDNIIERSLTGGSMDASKVYMASQWGGGENGKAIADTFNRYLRSTDGKLSDTEGSIRRQLSVAEQFEDLTKGIGDPRPLVQTLVNLGQREMLVRAGVLTEDNDIDRKALAKLLAGGDVEHASYEDPAGVASGRGGRESIKGLTSLKKSIKAGNRAQMSALSNLVETSSSSASSIENLARQDSIRARDALSNMAGGSIVNERIVSIDETLKTIAALLRDSASSSQQTVTLIREGAGLQLEAMQDMIKTSIKGFKLEDQADELLSSSKRSFTSLWEHATTVGGEKIKAGMNTAKGLFDKYKDPVGQKINAASVAATVFGRKIGNKLSASFGDVYIGSERFPRLTMEALRRGEYFDKATSKVITKLEDIRGDVVDSDGNIVLTVEDMENAYVGGAVRKKLAEVMKTGLRGLLNLKNAAQRLIPEGVAQVMNLGKNAINKFKSLLPPYDVYVRTDMEKPVLYANLMKYDEYYSKKTGRPIKHPRDIDGEITDKKGNILIGKEQLQAGLVDKDGVVVGSPVARIAGKALNFARRGIAALAQIGGTAMGALGQFMDKFKGFFKDMFTPFTEVITNSRRTVKLLENIYDLLDNRLPGGKRVRGDMDGDGIRDGSVEDIRRKKAEAEEKKREEKVAKEEEKNPSFLSKLFAKMGGLGGLFGFGKKDKDEEDSEGDSSMLEDAADAASIYDAVTGDGEGKKGGRGKGAKAPKTTGGGRLRRGLGKIGSGAKWLGAGALGLGKKVFNPTAKGPLGTIGRGAGWLAKKGAYSTALVRGLAGGAGMLGKGAAMLGKGAAGLAGSQLLRTAGVMGLRAAGMALSWPVTLAATAAYGGYKYYQYTKKTKLTDMSKIRLAQYGFLEESEDWMQKVFELEQYFEEHATIAEDGNLFIDRKKIDMRDVVEKMGIQSKRSLNMFNRWYDNRFMPVFRKHLTEMRKIKPDGKIAKIEAIVPGKDKYNYILNTTGDLEQAHNYMQGPTQAVEKLQTDHAAVMQMVEDAKAKFAKEAEKDGGPKATAEAKEDVASTIKNASKLAEKVAGNSGNYSVKDKDGKEVIGLSAADLAEKIKTGAVTVEIAVKTPENLLHVESKRLDALTSIRMKAYGLTEMSIDKVRVLGALERLVEDNITPGFDNVRLKADSKKLIQDAGAYFGLNNTTGENAVQWKHWFNGRFLPVFLMYVSALRQITKKENLKEALDVLPIGKQLELARQLTATTGLNERGMKVPVWEISSSPWPGYTLNDNPDSCAGNIETIRLLADKVVLGEVTTTALDKKQKSFFANNSQHKRSGSTAKVDGVGTRASGDEYVSGAGGGAAETAVGGGQKGISSSGQRIQISNGKSGMMGQMPNSSGSGWNAMKPIIIEAAKLAGVDAKSLASFIATESGFDPNAMPPVGRGGKRASSAKGLGQFLDGTWNEMLSKHGRKFGIPAGTSPLDPRANALMTAMYMKENSQSLQKTLGRDVSVTDAYLAHFLGPGGARQFLSANPESLGVEIMPRPARANPGIFFKNGRALKIREIYEAIRAKITGKAATFGVTEADFSESTSAGGATEGAPSGGDPSGSASTPSTSTGAAAPAQSTGMGPVAQTSYGTTAPVNATQMPGVGSPRLGGTIVADESVKSIQTPTGPAMRQLSGNAMYTLTLRREKSEDDGTYGTLQFPDGTTLQSLELPWIDNKPRISCIPSGTYKCVFKPSPRFGMAYEVTGVPGRSAVLIHAGNTAGNVEKGHKADSLGCILLGMNRGRNGSQKVITASKPAMQVFSDKMAGQPFMLNIIGGEASSPEAAAAKMSENIEAIKNSAPAPAVSVAREALAQPSQITPPISSASSSTPSTGSTLPPLGTGAARPALSPSFTPPASVMAQRDKALNSEIAPRIEGIATTLTQSLETQRAATDLLGKILLAVQDGASGKQIEQVKQQTTEPGKMRPVSNTATPVTPRRGL